MGTYLQTCNSNPLLLTSCPGPVHLIADEKLLLELVNRERMMSGFSAFLLDMHLVELARLKSEEMFKENYFSHLSPSYGTAYDQVRGKGIKARVMGAENIAKASTTRRAHELIMSSEAHRSNILNSLHDTIGIGIYSSPHGVVVTQLFLGH